MSSFNRNLASAMAANNGRAATVETVQCDPREQGTKYPYIFSNPLDKNCFPQAFAGSVIRNVIAKHYQHVVRHGLHECKALLSNL
jgi:hypothetical protein